MTMTIGKKEKEKSLNGEEVLAKYDKESNVRKLHGPVQKLIFVLAVAWSSFQIYTAIFGTFPSTIQRGTHISAALMLVFLLYPAVKGKN